MTTGKPSGLDVLKEKKRGTKESARPFPTARPERSASLVLPEISEPSTVHAPASVKETRRTNDDAAGDRPSTPKWRLTGSRRQVPVSFRWREDLHTLIGEVVAALEVELGQKTSRRELVEALVVSGLEGASSESVAARIMEYRRDSARSVAV